MSPAPFSRRTNGLTLFVMPAHRSPLPTRLTEQPFTRTDALASGVNAGVLRGPGVVRIDRGLYLDANLELNRVKRLVGYLRLLPRQSVIDSVTALQLWGIDVGPPEPLRFCSTAKHHSRRAAVRVRRAPELPPHKGPVTLPVPALVAARNDLGLLDLVAAGDWLLRLRLGTLDEIRRELATATGRGCRTSRRAAELVRERVRSPQETKLRLVTVLSGLPEPECNVDIGDEFFFMACVDLYLRRWGIVMEYEGDQHRTDPRQFHHDIGRYEELTAAGYLVIRFTKVDMQDPRRVATRIYRALVSRGYDGPPPTYGTEWCSVFGGEPDQRVSSGAPASFPDR